MKHPPLLFLDIETLGLELDSPVWEVAAWRIGGDDSPGTWPVLDRFLLHVPLNEKPDDLPQSFWDDYRQRYDITNAWELGRLIRQLQFLARDRAIVCGSNPSFDMDRLERLAVSVDATLPWHYHPIDVPTLVHGWLLGRGVAPAPPWKSDFLSQAAGVDVSEFDRHTAMGDVLWCKAMWDLVTA